MQINLDTIFIVTRFFASAINGEWGDGKGPYTGVVEGEGTLSAEARTGVEGAGVCALDEESPFA